MYLENLKRVFHRWLTTARATRHRRLTLQRLERGKSQANLQAAWDHWRERFIDIGLRHTVGLFTVTVLAVSLLT